MHLQARDIRSTKRPDPQEGGSTLLFKPSRLFVIANEGEARRRFQGENLEQCPFWKSFISLPTQ
jgi:hypothetical protein